MSLNLNTIGSSLSAQSAKVKKGSEFNNTSMFTGFSDTLKKTMNELNAMEKQVEKDSQDLAAGTLNSPHEALANAEKTELALQLVLQVRSKCLDAYNEIMRMNF